MSWLPNLTCKAQLMHREIPIEVTVTFIHHLGTFRVDLMINICRQFTATWSNFCERDNARVNDTLHLGNVITWDLLWQFYVHRGLKPQFEVTNHSIFIKWPLVRFLGLQRGLKWLFFTYLLKNDGCSSLFKHLYLALTPNKHTLFGHNGGVRFSWPSKFTFFNI